MRIRVWHFVAQRDVHCRAIYDSLLVGRHGATISFAAVMRLTRRRRHIQSYRRPFLTPPPPRPPVAIHPLSKACLQHSQTVFQPCMSFLQDGTG